MTPVPLPLRRRMRPPIAPRPRPFDADDAAQVLAGRVWWADPIPAGRRVGVMVVAVDGRPVGVHVEAGLPDARRQAAARAQGWLYLSIAPPLTGGDAVIAAVDAHRRMVAALCAGRRP